MNIAKNPPLLDQLAASYALGTLRGGARRRFEVLAREQAPVRAAALIWQSRWSGLTELQVEMQPSPAVWTRIDNLVRAERQAKSMQAARAAHPASPTTGWFNSLLLWRGAAFAGLTALALLVTGHLSMRDQLDAQIARLSTQLQQTPPVSYVAMLSDAQSRESMLVTFDPVNNKLVLQRVNGFQEASDKSLQLWALPPAGAPRSLGVLGHDKLLKLTALESQVREVPALAISLEPLGGVPSERGPTGPVLFKGRLIERTL